MSSPEETNGRPVIRDLRRIDPATGQVRDSGQGGSAQPGSRGPSKPRGKHAASRPGGAASMGASAPAGPGARPGAGYGARPESGPGEESGTGPAAGGPVAVALSVRQVACPRCGSVDTEELARFGSTACKALRRCRACGEPFDEFKAI